MVLSYVCHSIWHVQITVDNISGNFDKPVKQFQVLIRPKQKVRLGYTFIKTFK